MMPVVRLLIVLVVAQALVPPPSGAQAAVAARAEESIAALVESGLPLAWIETDTLALQVESAVLTFYRRRHYRPAWTGPGRLTHEAEALVERLRRPDADGLRGLRSPLHAVERLLRAGRQAQADVLLSAAFAAHAIVVAAGRVAPGDVDPGWRHFPRRPVDPVIALDEVVATGDADSALHRMAPDFPGYRTLQRALLRYVELQAGGGWQPVTAGPVLVEGAQGERVRLVRARLQATGDLAVDHPPGEVYDRGVADAVRRFQARHGLDVDGVVGPKTLAAMNVPVESRVRQIELNMERYRWLPPPAPTHVIVDLPAGRLAVVDEGREVARMRVALGEECRPVPMVADEIEYILANPFWHVPAGSATEEIARAAQQDPSYLARRGIRIFTSWEEDAAEIRGRDIDWARTNPEAFPYVFRHDANALNPLGRITFMLRGRFDVYLHAFPEGQPADAVARPGLPGCIRLESPLEVAAFAIRNDPDVSPALVERAVASGLRYQILVREPLPVYVLYWTAWVEPDGTVSFREDVDGLDVQLARALEAPPPANAARRQASAR
jgi:L,D-transpeptidase YcbB